MNGPAEMISPPHHLIPSHSIANPPSIPFIPFRRAPPYPSSVFTNRTGTPS